ncbi:uncharacterized protein [Procambarus clarkii]|uniref:uncharacterized protein isoform X5 n=1 Tax=Procambarus clarkii TaxID=6728 RepID=UPI001E677F87|nr:uncharacterized protein LOC123747090 isoform X7 [Procambarus clarkii]
MRRAVAGGVGPGGRLPQLGAQFLFTWGNVSGESPRYEISGNMTEGNTMGVEREEYVEVVQDYSYQRDDRTFHMTKGEILMLLKRSTSDWWQVIRQGEQRPFFAPVQYVHITTVPQEQMKQFIKQGRQQQKLHQKQSSDEIIPVNRPQGLSLQQMESLSASANVEIPFTINPVTSHSYMATIEPTGVVSERRDQFPNRPHGFSSFKNDSLKGLSPRNSSSSSNELLSPNSRGPAHGGQESSSSHTSKSSLNDGSMESLKYLHSRKQGIKAASHDELICGNRSQSTLDVSQPRAASNEELDGHYSGRDYIFKSNQLSYRHRSNSVDFRLFQKELSFSEMKQGSLDKSRKPRLSKDPGNRRRSWAVEELRASENFRPSLRRGETVDAAIVLDVPPKLPPKQRKQRLETFNSSSENIGILEGPIDIKLQEVKLSMAPSGINVNSQSHSREMGHYRHTSDPLILSENEHKNSLSRHDAQDLKDPPVALPRKILPPQVSSLERNKEDEESTKSMKVGISASVSLGDSLPRETNSSQVKKSSSHSNLSSNPASKGGGILKRGASLSKGNHGPKICTNPDSVPKIPGTIDLLRIDGGTPTSTRKDYGPPESPRKHHISSGKVAGIIETWRSFKYKGERRDCKKEDEKENEGGIMSSRETPTPDTSRGGKMTQTPPSPQTSPQRIVFDDWGEYIDEGTKRQYFYNTRTREKRWKPPRKGIHSVAIPEVPPSARQEEPRCGSSRPPRSPAPDYPNSPKSSHKPFSYSNLPEGYLPSQLNRAATLTPASSVTSHPQLVSSLTLPAYGVSSHKNMSLHFPSNAHQIPALGSNTPPIAPPSSAKPHYPSTPTTEFPELPETESNSALLDILYNMSPPKGWRKEYDALTQMVYFYNTATKQRWLATNNDEGKIYYYEESGSKSLWRLPQIDDCDNSSVDGKGIRVSTIAENLAELSANIVKEGFLHRTFFLRDGKKVRKNWTQSYVRFIVGAFNSGSSGLLYFSKTKDEDKKAEIFEFYPTCYLEHTTDKKTSRQQVLGLRNGHDTEVLLQFEDKDIAVEWFKILETHEGVQYSVAPTLEKEEKKGKRGSEKIKREASVEHLNPDSKGITDKLRNFIKRRPLKETLEKKGIYKESVFGSTLAELHIQDKTTIPIFVLQCINHIEKNHENLHTDGLYRISGNAAQIQKIRFEVAQRNYSILSREKEIHNLSGALKLFFRELKEPLIPFDNYQDFIQATGSEYRRMNQQVEKLTKAVNRLPPENYDTLKVLLQHLLRVSEFESENRMSISNLAIVFGPCLLWPQVTSSHDLMTDVMLHNRVIEGLLSDFSQIFSSRK